MERTAAALEARGHTVVRLASAPAGEQWDVTHAFGAEGDVQHVLDHWTRAAHAAGAVAGDRRLAGARRGRGHARRARPRHRHARRAAAAGAAARAGARGHHRVRAARDRAAGGRLAADRGRRQRGRAGWRPRRRSTGSRAGTSCCWARSASASASARCWRRWRGEPGIVVAGGFGGAGVRAARVGGGGRGGGRALARAGGRPGGRGAAAAPTPACSSTSRAPRCRASR